MSITRTSADIVRDVRSAIDMNGTDNKLFDIKDAETLEIDDIIRKSIEPALNYVLQNAPLHMLVGKPLTGKVTFEQRAGGSTYIGTLHLPDDYMRLQRIKMKSWRHAISSTITTDDALYTMCRSHLNGIAGTPDCPAAAIIPGEPSPQMELYSSDSSTDTIQEGRYIPYTIMQGHSARGTRYFIGMEAVKEILQGGVMGDVEALYDTKTQLFVFRKKALVHVPDEPWTRTCDTAYLYNDEEREPATVRQDCEFNDGKSIYAYDASTGGLKKVADIAEESVDIPDMIYHAVIYRTAYLTCNTLGDDAAAKRMDDNLNEEFTKR